MQDLRTAQMEKTVNEQASEIATLKEQMAAKELNWEQEKQKIFKALKSERQSRKTAKAGKDVTEDAKLKTQQENFEEKKLRQTILDLESYATQKDSELIQNEEKWKIKLTVLKDWMRSELAKESFQREQQLQRQSREMEEWRNLKEENKLLRQQNADLQVHNLSLQELAQQTDEEKEQFKNFEKKLRQTILDLESYATQKDSELIRNEAEWKIKVTALEDWMRSELAAKEESFEREQQLQRQRREMEEEIKLLTQQNADLQVHNLSLQKLAQQTDKEKAQFNNLEKKYRETILDMENYATQKGSELIQNEERCKMKLINLEDRMRSEFAAKEKRFEREQQLQRQWRNKKEEEIKLLTQQNADLQVHNLSLQELAQQTDKEKAQFKKEEKKARKEAEKTVKKERKEREKKEKNENEKREKEELKRQKKERKENEKREKGELKRQKELMENKRRGE